MCSMLQVPTERAENLGPKPPFSLWPTAVVKLHQTRHSSIAQHFRKTNVVDADKAALTSDQVRALDASISLASWRHFAPAHS